jgi:hypothetical protein
MTNGYYVNHIPNLIKTIDHENCAKARIEGKPTLFIFLEQDNHGNLRLLHCICYARFKCHILETYY